MASGAFESISNSLRESVNQSIDRGRFASQMGSQQGAMAGRTEYQRGRDLESDSRFDQEFALREQQFQQQSEIEKALFPLRENNLRLQGLVAEKNLYGMDAQQTLQTIAAEKGVQQSALEKDEATTYADYVAAARNWSQKPIGEPPTRPAFQADRYNALADRLDDSLKTVPAVKARNEILEANAERDFKAGNAILATGNYTEDQINAMPLPEKLALAKSIGWQDEVKKTDLVTESRLRVAQEQAKGRIEAAKARMGSGKLPEADKIRVNALFKQAQAAQSAFNPEAATQYIAQAEAILDGAAPSGPAIQTSPGSTNRVKTVQDASGKTFQVELINGQWQPKP
jgi:hypothetical protein